jgi:hypothetical protein
MRRRPKRGEAATIYHGDTENAEGQPLGNLRVLCVSVVKIFWACTPS